MIIGEINTLEVKRIGDISYVLTDGKEEIFLHKKEAKSEHIVGEKLNCFIYQDSKRRICASETKPLITVSKPAWLKVVGVKDEVGYFLYDGMPKDLLLAADDCTFQENEKPNIGDYLFVFLKATGGTFRARLVPKAMYTEFLKPEGTLRIGDFYKAFVTSRSVSGVTANTADGFEIFIPKGNDRYNHRIGEPLTIEILKKIDETHYQGTLLKKKVVQMDEDSKRIYEYLKRNIVLGLNDNSSPIEIYNQFQLSKASFKRAVGHLLKEHLIEIDNGIIKLKVEEK